MRMKKCYPEAPALCRLLTLFLLLPQLAAISVKAEKTHVCVSVSPYAYGHHFSSPRPIPPVVNLTASIIQQKEIQLQWGITQPRDISHFEIQHSSNGRSFSSIGIVKLKLGSDAAELVYAFQHLRPVKGRNFYKIKTVFLNKTNEQSEIVPVIFSDIADSTREVKVFPNPSKGTVYFSAESNEVAQYQLYLFDIEGKLLRQKMILANQTALISALQRGTYLFEIFKNDERIDRGQLIVN